MSVFNAGSNSRDAYFMLKLLTLALKEEIKINCTKAAEIKTSNLYILKAIVDQARCFDNQKRLNTIFRTVVEKVCYSFNLSNKHNFKKCSHLIKK